MVAPGEVDLVAVVAARPRAAELVRAAWSDGRAVTVLDPAAPAAVRAAQLDQLAPTHVLTADGIGRCSGGVPVAEGSAAVVVTSGTTGRPKGVELTRAGGVAAGMGWGPGIGHEPDDRWIGCVPLHHVARLVILAPAPATAPPAP